MSPIKVPIRSNSLEHEFHSGRRFVVRACKVRKVYAGHKPIGPKRYLKDYVDSLPELGRFTMDVQAQLGRKARKNAEFIVRGAAVLVCRPHAKHGHHGDDPLPLYVVQITEANPPAGEKAIDLDLADQRAGAELRGCVAGGRMVRAALDH